MQRTSRPAFLVMILILILPAMLSAQSFWLERSAGKSLGLELFKPSFDNSTLVFNRGEYYPVDFSFKTFAVFLSTRWPVGSKTFGVAELPFAHAEFDTEIDQEFSFYRNSGHESMIGNPYVGFEFGGISSPFFAEVGVRLPLVAEDYSYALRAGVSADGDRPEAFIDFAAVKVALNYQRRGEAGLIFRFRLGAAYLRKSGDMISGRGFTITPAARIGYKTGRISAGAFMILPGEHRIVSTASRGLGFMNRGANTNLRVSGQAGLWANIDLGSLQPGVYVSDSFDINFGVQLR